MVTIYQLKPGFQALLRPLCNGLGRRGVTANMVTSVAMVASVAYGAWMLCPSAGTWPFLLLPVFLLMRMALNAIDGMLAREHNQATPLGAVLNEIGDVVSDACLYLPFALLPQSSPVLVVLIVLLALCSEFAGVLAQALTGERRYDGPMGKSDRAAVFGLWGLLVGCGISTARFLVPLLVLLAALLIWTTINRLRRASQAAALGSATEA